MPKKVYDPYSDFSWKDSKGRTVNAQGKTKLQQAAQDGRRIGRNAVSAVKGPKQTVKGYSKGGLVTKCRSKPARPA